MSNFLGLNWGLFKEYATDLDKVVSSFMSIIRPVCIADLQKHRSLFSAKVLKANL